MRIDLGRLTEEETADVLRESINLLPEHVAIQIICEAFTGDMREELIASLEASNG